MEINLKYLKVKDRASIIADPRIAEFHLDYDGKGKHAVVCKAGFKFESFDSTMEIGNIKELCYEINERLVAVE